MESWKKYKNTDWYKKLHKRTIKEFKERNPDYFSKYLKEYFKTYKISKDKLKQYQETFKKKHPNYRKERYGNK